MNEIESELSKYGKFNEKDGCFEMTGRPPRKWWNLHCNRIGDDEIYAQVSSINDGETYVRDCKGVKVVLCGWDQKYHYIRDDETNTCFCPAGNPLPTPVQDRIVKFYREKTVMESTCAELKASQRVFVPLDLPIECTTIRLKNLSNRTRKVSVFSYVLFSLYGCDSEGRWVDRENYTEILPSQGGVICVNRNPHTPTNRFKAYLICLENFYNATGYRDYFTREEYSTGAPRIIEGWDCDGQAGYGPDCAAAVQVKLTIPPHGEARADFILGQCSGVEEIESIRKKLSPPLLDQWCEEAAQVEKERASAYRVEVGHPIVDGIFNIFIKKQHYCYLINKSGFRDNLQVDCALAMSDFRSAEDNLLRALASQYPAGNVPHSFRPLNRLQYSDKPAWILMTVPLLVQESGDYSLLEKKVPYFESNEVGTVWDHCLRAYRFLANDLGKHGLCRQHHADWNDGLEATKATGERESVFVTQQLCYGLREIRELARRINDKNVQEEADFLYKKFSNHLNEIAWDGEWYLRTFCEDGYRIGSRKNREGAIFLNTQSWAVISGIAPEDRARLCMQKVDEILETDIGFRICYPPYSEYDPRVGRMSSSIPGANENGGCYNHAAGFKCIADCILGRAEQAWRTLLKVTPGGTIENPLSRSWAEPFSYVNSYSSVKQIYGRSGYAWRTGTAGWMAMALIEWILGARRHYDGLLIDPCIPPGMKNVKVERLFRGCRYIIEIYCPQGKGGKAKKIELDGKALSSQILPKPDKPIADVKVLV